MKKIIIGFAGLAGSGKSTAARALEDIGFLRLPFAGPMKGMALDLGFTAGEISTGKEQPFDWFSLPPALSDQAARRAVNRIVPFGWFHPHVAGQSRSCLGGKSVNAVVDDLKDWYAADRAQWTTPRRFLQRLGTEWGRDRICSNLWIEAWRNQFGESAAEHFGDILIVSDDVRFENEAIAIRQEGGLVVRIEREGAGSLSGAAHASEAGVTADITLENDGSPEDLSVRVTGLLDRLYAAEAI